MLIYIVVIIRTLAYKKVASIRDLEILLAHQLPVNMLFRFCDKIHFAVYNNGLSKLYDS